MIRVEMAPSPPDFGRRVATPGATFLRQFPKPTTKQFDAHSYWRVIQKELHDSYSGICAYTCHFIAYDTGAPTVEHFVPKSKNPRLAYRWDNYRLVSSRLNGRKGNHEDVLDPFKIDDGMFILDFPSLLVRANPTLDKRLVDAVNKTISRLKLNDDDSCVRARLSWVEHYCKEAITFDFLAKCAPFIAKEILRQKIQTEIQTIMSIQPSA